MSSDQLYDSLSKLDTEQRNKKTQEIDLASSLQIVKFINDEDKLVAERIAEKSEIIAEAIELISASFSIGGRLLYFGAGTSGRLGVLDAAECPPTFGSNPEQVQGFIAGGPNAMFVAQEGAEDSEELGRDEITRLKITSLDVVCGIAASGRTPYVHGVIKEANDQGIKTILITTVPKEQLTLNAHLIIDVPVGPEVIMGSTRMKSGTAQKMILNMLSTGAFIRQGKIYENVMVDLMLTNKKLVERAKRIISTFSKCSYEEATLYLERANGHVKTALMMAIGNISYNEAMLLLRKNQGFIRKALEEL